MFRKSKGTSHNNTVFKQWVKWFHYANVKSSLHELLYDHLKCHSEAKSESSGSTTLGLQFPKASVKLKSVFEHFFYQNPCSSYLTGSQSQRRVVLVGLGVPQKTSLMTSSPDLKETNDLINTKCLKCTLKPIQVSSPNKNIRIVSFKYNKKSETDWKLHLSVSVSLSVSLLCHPNKH